ncbi:hypothetical protein SPCG_0358 [Streptococcus pneumoniae CGSP14]|nr:hypothetical protein SPCG_0358 [Streptococcus pneumoniae CGSP14]
MFQKELEKYGMEVGELFLNGAPQRYGLTTL